LAKLRKSHTIPQKNSTKDNQDKTQNKMEVITTDTQNKTSVTDISNNSNAKVTCYSYKHKSRPNPISVATGANSIKLGLCKRQMTCDEHPVSKAQTNNISDGITDTGVSGC
jgi:hypothetical protein